MNNNIKGNANLKSPSGDLGVLIDGKAISDQVKQEIAAEVEAMVAAANAVRTWL